MNKNMFSRKTQMIIEQLQNAAIKFENSLQERKWELPRHWRSASIMNSCSALLFITWRAAYVRTGVRAIMSHKVIASGFRQKCHRHRWKTTSQTSRFWVASKNTIVFQPLFLFTIITLYHLLILHHSKRRFGLISFFFFAHRWSLWMSGPFYGMKFCRWMLWWCNDLSTERRITLMFKTPTLV